MNHTLWEAASLIVPLILAIVCHEVAHGLMARALGDRTASEQGRLTLNPLAHIDPMGTVILPGMLALAHLPVFGWAKPVPVNPWRLRDPRHGMMLVAAAGPGANLLLAGVASVALGLLARQFGGVPDGSAGAVAFVVSGLVKFLAINLFLALFNLIPLPPFDGSHILEGLLPDGLARAYGRLRGLGMALVLVVLLLLPMVTGVSVVSHLVGPPFEWLLNQYLHLAEWVAGLPLNPELG